MNELTRDYLRQRQNSFWQWSGAGEAVTWTDGRTIVFREELTLIYRQSTARRLPSFSITLLVLAACRKDWSEELALGIFDQLEGADETNIADAARARARRKAIAQFTDLHRFFLDSPANTTSKAILLDMFSEQFQKENSSPSASILHKELRFPVFPEILFQPEEQEAMRADRSTFGRQLRDAIRRMTPGRLKSRQLTGLEVLPDFQEDSELELPEPEVLTPVQFLKSLKSNEEFSGLVQLTHHLAGILHFPQHLLEETELPVGGVSDITNRGPYDRLLLSELANDTDVLMTRLAMNEALYIRREKPPANPSHTQIVLQDMGIRMWGVPRLFATAAGLSVLVNPSRTDEISLYRANGSDVEQFAANSLEELQAHLAVITPDLHPGAALPQLMENMEPDSDLILITSPAGALDKGLRESLRNIRVARLFLITVDRKGEIRFLHWTPQGDRILKQAKVDLDLLYASPAKRPKLIDSRQNPDLPAICHMEPFPLRLSHQVHPYAAFLLGDLANATQLLAITHDCRLTLWDDRKRGALQLSDKIPLTKRILGARHDALNNWADLIIGTPGTTPLHQIQVDLSSGETEVNVIARPPQTCTHIFFLQSVVCLYDQKRRNLTAIDLSTGREVCRDVSIPYQHLSGRFFKNEYQHILALSFADGVPTYTTVLPAGSYAQSDILAIADCPALGCPVAVNRQGSVFKVDGDSKSILGSISLPQEGAPVFCCDGQRIAVPEKNGYYRVSWMTWQLPDMKPHKLYGSDLGDALNNSWVTENVKLRTYRNAMQGVRINKEGQIQFKIRDEFREFILLGLHRMQFKSAGVTIEGQDFQFGQSTAPDQAKYKFQRIEFPQGGWMILDSRGLLHLRGSDHSLPEITFVLDDQDVSGVTSDGLYFGIEYFIGDQQTKAGTTILERYLKPIVRSWL